MEHLAADPGGDEVRGDAGRERHRRHEVGGQVAVELGIGLVPGITAEEHGLVHPPLQLRVVDGAGDLAALAEEVVDVVRRVGMVDEPVEVGDVPGLSGRVDPLEELTDRKQAYV